MFHHRAPCCFVLYALDQRDGGFELIRGRRPLNHGDGNVCGQPIFLFSAGQEGQEIQGRRSYDIAALGIGFVPEHRAIFRDLSVAENLRIAERKRGDLARKEEFLFSLFPDLKRLIKLSGTNLSGGQQQMLAVARALVPDNKLLLIDEPSEGLAPVIIEQMMEAIRQLSAETTVLLVEQNFVVASQLAESYVIIEEGQSVKTGAMVDLISDQETIHRYLGAA